MLNNDGKTELHMNIDITDKGVNALVKMLDESDSDFLDKLFRGTEHLFLTRGSVTIELVVVNRVEHVTEDDAKKAAKILKDFCNMKGLAGCSDCIFLNKEKGYGDCNLYTNLPTRWPI